jgi:hypothetical protein
MHQRQVFAKMLAARQVQRFNVSKGGIFWNSSTLYEYCSNKDPDLTLHSMMNAVVGAQRRLAFLGNRVEKEYGQPVDRMFRETARTILLGLRATCLLGALNVAAPVCMGNT